MQPLRLNKIAERVILLQTDAAGNVTPITVYKKKRKKVKDTWMKKPGTTAMKKMRSMGDNVFRMMDSGRKSFGMGGFPM